MDRLPARPTNKDLGERLVQVHDCLEGHKKGNDKHFKVLFDDMVEVKSALGLQPGQKPTIATNSGRQSFMRTVLATGTALGSIGGLLLAYRAVVALAPATLHWFVVLNRVILSGKY